MNQDSGTEQITVKKLYRVTKEANAPLLSELLGTWERDAGAGSLKHSELNFNKSKDMSVKLIFSNL